MKNKYSRLKTNFTKTKRVTTLFLQTLFLLIGTSMSLNAQYCIPTYTYGCQPAGSDNIGINDFSIIGENSTSIMDLSSGCSVNSYDDKTALSAVELNQGYNYTVNIASNSNYNAEYVAIWIDFNDDYIFDGNELVGASTVAIGYGGVVQVNIPITATIGTHRMRVALSYDEQRDPSTFDPCYPRTSPTNSYQSFGETADYMVKVLAPNACSGMPNAGVASAPSSVCVNSDFTLISTGATLYEAGQSRYWQSSPAGQNIWTDIVGAMNDSYTIASGISAATDYRYIITCTNTSDSDTSNVFSVVLSPVTECYYTYDLCSFDMSINNVELVGETLTLDNNSTCNAFNYEDFTSTTTIPDLKIGSSYSLDVSTDYMYNGTDHSSDQNVRAWIDYNNDGFFDNTEEIVTTNGAGIIGGLASFNFTVNPIYAIAGQHTLRVRMTLFGANPIDPTAIEQYGETEDYTINVISAPLCSAMPSAGTINGPSSICFDTDFTLSETGATSTYQTGLTRKWQSSPAGQNVWTDIVGATTAPYTVTGGISAATDYRYIIICTNTSDSDTSNIVNVALIPETECYYSDNLCLYNLDIVQVKLAGESVTLDNPSGCNAFNYEDFTTATPIPDLIVDSTYTLTVSTTYMNYGNDFSSAQNVSAWIDYNGNGVYESHEEIVATNGAGLVLGTTDLNFTVDAAYAAAGQYTMRVRMVFQGSGPIHPTASEVYGETEDYTVNISLVAPICSGMPNAGVVSAPSTICPNSDFSITTTGGSTFEVGQSRKWQSSPMGDNTWTDIVGGTSNPFTIIGGITAAMDYRYIITCTNTSDSDTSNVFSVVLSPETECYYTYDLCGLGMNINNVELVGETLTLDNNSTCNAFNYEDFTTTATIPDLMIGSTYTLNVTTTFMYNSYDYSSDQNVRAWIDYNNDGIFDNTEEIVTTNGAGMSGGLASLSFTVNPTYASVGQYKMRVRMNLQGSNPIDPSAVINYGETEDYTVNIIPMIACSGMPDAGLIDGPSTICNNTDFTLNTIGSTINRSGLSRKWQSSIAGQNVWTDIVGSTADSCMVTGGISVATDYRYIITCTNTSDSDTSTVFSVALSPETECYYSDNLCQYALYIENVNLVGQTLTLDNPSTCGAFNYEDYRGITTAPDLLVGNTYTLTVSTAFMNFGNDYSATQNVSAWIDYNGNGVFDASEEIVATNGSGMTGGMVALNFTVNPSLATTGQYTMRVRMTQNDSNPIDPSAVIPLGETEDYTVNIICGSMSVNLGLDQSYCAGEAFSTTIDAGNAGATYLWNNGSTNQTLTATTAGTYSVIVTDINGCKGKDTIVITEDALPIINLGNDFSYCVGSTLSATLDAQNTGATYLWNDNSTNQTLTVTTAGTYSVIVTDANSCVGKDTIVVTEDVALIVDLGIDQSYCAGSAFSSTLDAQYAGATYLWNDNSANQTLTATTAGTYSVIVTDIDGCVGKDTIVITEKVTPIVNLGPDDSYCAGTTFSTTLNAGNTGANYLWSDGSTNQTLNVSTAGTYSVTVTNANNCSANGTITITEDAAPVVNLGTVTSYCAGSSMTLDAGNTGATYLWNDGSTNQTLNVSVAGTYSVTVTNANNCSANGTITITESTLPVVDLGTVTTYCAGSSMTLDAGNTGATYLWNDNSTNQTLNVSAAGTYSVTVKNTNNCSANGTITITESTLPVVDLGPITSYCVGSSMTLDAGNAGATYLWNDNSTNQTLSVSTAGTYSVAVTDANNCSANGSITITENALPVVDLGSDDSYCAGTTFSTILDAQNTGASYLWNDNSTNQTLTATTAGSYSVIVTDIDGCVGKDTVVVTENTLPVVNLGNDFSYCVGSTLSTTLDAQNTGATYLWNDNSTNQTLTVTTDGTYSVIVTDVNNCVGKDTVVVTEDVILVVNLGNDISYCEGSAFSTTFDAQYAGASYVWNDNSTNQTLVVTSAGTYSVVITDGSGCEGKDTIVVTENALPIVNLGNDLSYCEGSTFSTTLDAQNAGATYLWNDNSTNQTLTATTAGTYSVVVTSANSCSGNDTIVITEDALPTVAQVTSTDNGNNSYTFSATGVTNVTSYAWSFGDGAVSSAVNPTYNYTTPGNFTVTLTVSNDCGTDSTSINIQSTVGVKDLEDENVISVYPNPSKGKYVITVSQEMNDVPLAIFTVDGKLIFEMTFNGKETQIDLSNHSAGMYFMQLGKVKLVKLVKE